MAHLNPRLAVKGKRFVCSWSGGKDCTLALNRAVSWGGIPGALITILSEQGERSRSHGVRISSYKAQAESLGMRLLTSPSSWEDYERTFLDGLATLKADGAEVGVFGDIDLAEHREWVEKTCARAGIGSCLPLWGQARDSLVRELLTLGFKTIIVAVNEEKMSPDFLGKELSPKLVHELEAAGVDIAGEGGEYHTFVTDGPLFRRPLKLVGARTVVREGGYRYLDFSVARD